MEIERKFLVETLPEHLEQYPKRRIQQAYLSTDPVVRVRRSGEEYVLTCKGPGFLSREEQEMPLTAAAYGRLLPQAVLDIPRYGCLNIHASLLPKYRGASPINACILHGETEAGVTIMQMDAGLDTGDMLLPVRTEILPDESCGSLHDRLAVLGGQAIVKALDLLEKGALHGQPQPEGGATYAPMIQTADCKIDFTRSAREVSCAIRAYDPAPGAFSTLGGDKMKLFAASPEQDEGGCGMPGTILKADKKGIVVACGRGAVRIGMVQGAGGKKMPADAFFRGHAALLSEIFR